MKPVGVPAALPPEGGDEYLSVAETASRVRLSVKRVHNLMSAGVLKEGYHFFRPAGIGPRFKWSRVVEWLEGREAIEPQDEVQPRARCRVDLSLIPALRNKRNGLQGPK